MSEYAFDLLQDKEGRRGFSDYLCIYLICKHKCQKQTGTPYSNFFGDIVQTCVRAHARTHRERPCDSTALTCGSPVNARESIANILSTLYKFLQSMERENKNVCAFGRSSAFEKKSTHTNSIFANPGVRRM